MTHVLSSSSDDVEAVVGGLDVDSLRGITHLVTAARNLQNGHWRPPNSGSAHQAFSRLDVGDVNFLHARLVILRRVGGHLGHLLTEAVESLRLKHPYIHGSALAQENGK